MAAQDAWLALPDAEDITGQPKNSKARQEKWHKSKT